VNIYNPGFDFMGFLEKQTEEMTDLMKQLGVI
jgi:putative tricarboxylic transport membrane protein